jgi:hypothetical protein
MWLLERYDVRTLEVHEDFFKFANLDCPKKERVTSRSAAAAAMFGQLDSAKFYIPSRTWVEQWINHPEQLEELQKKIHRQHGCASRITAGFEGWKDHGLDP